MQELLRPVFKVSIVVIMIFQFAALFARSALDLALIDGGYSTALAKDLSYLVVPPILLVLMYPYLKRCKVSLAHLLQPTDLTVRLVVFSILLGLSLRIAWWSVLTILIWAGVEGVYDPNAVTGPLLGFNCPPPPVLFLSFAVMSVLVPIIEEVINRGFVLHRFLPRGVAISVVVSSLLFAIMHPPGGYVWTFCAGLFLAFQMLNYRTLWAPMIAHATYNGAMIIDWDCFRIIWNPPPGDPQFLAVARFSVPVAVAAIGAAVFLVSKKVAGASNAPRRV